ncbi:MAG: hypothetical protein EPN86_06060, partial [Nanoarchaeota archaeon]
MNVGSLLEDVENSQPYKDWKKDNPQHFFLISLFAQIEDEKPVKWHVNYFCPGTEKTITFVTFPEIEFESESELASNDVKALDSSNATITFPEIIDKASEAFSSNYPNHTYKKLLATLHQEERATWAINFLTEQAQTINMRISADTGEVLSQKLFSLKDLT